MFRPLHRSHPMYAGGYLAQKKDIGHIAHILAGGSTIQRRIPA
jgi:hypothetical protein